MNTKHKNRTILVLASTYPRYHKDPEPSFVHHLNTRLARKFSVTSVVPDAPLADQSGPMDEVEVIRFRYAPKQLQTLVNDGGILANLKRSPWKWLLVPLFIVFQFWAARKEIKAGNVDVIHAHWLVPQGLIAWCLKRLYHVSFVVTCHGGDVFSLRGPVSIWVKRKIAASASAISVVNTAMQNELVKLGNFPRVVVLPMGVDCLVRFVPNTAQSRVPNQLLFVGRLVPKKGLNYLLDALPQVLAAVPGVQLTIVGFGPQEADLKIRAKQLGIDSHVTFTGACRQEDLPLYYQCASLFVAPFVRADDGDEDGLPVTLMEAIACECPVIAGDVAGVHDLLDNFASRVCVNPKQTTTLSSAIVSALQNPNDAQQTAIKLRELVLQRYDWSHVAQTYAELLSSSMTLETSSHDDAPR